MHIRLVQDVGLDHQVVVNELRRVGVVGPDAPHPGRGQKDIVGLFLGKNLWAAACSLKSNSFEVRPMGFVKPAFSRRRQMAPPTRP